MSRPSLPALPPATVCVCKIVAPGLIPKSRHVLPTYRYAGLLGKKRIPYTATAPPIFMQGELMPSDTSSIRKVSMEMDIHSLSTQSHESAA